MRLRTSGIKERDVDFELQQLNFIIGPHASSKSTAAEALRFLAAGFVPALGKTPASTAALMRGGAESMWAQLQLDDGRTILRSLERSGTGFQLGAEASWLTSKSKPTEHGKAILGLFGTEEVDVAEILDIRQLLNATPSQRTARVEAMLSATQKSPAEKADAIARYTLIRLSEVKDESHVPENFRDLKKMVPKRQQKFLDENAEALGSRLQDLGIAGAQTWANERKRNAADGLRSKTAARDTLQIRAAEVPEPSPSMIEQLEAKRTEAERAVGAAAEKMKSVEREKEHRARAQAELHAATAARDEAEARPADDTVLRQLQDEHAKLPTEPELRAIPADPRIEQLRAKAREAREKADAIKFQDLPDTTEARLAVRRLEEELKEAKDSPWDKVRAIAKRLKTIKAAKGATIVPEAARELAALADEHSKDSEAIDAQLLEAKDVHEKAVARYDAELEARKDKIAERDRLTKEASSAEGDANVLDQAQRETARTMGREDEEKRREWRSKNARITQQLSEERRRLDAVRQAQVSAGERFERAKKAFEDLGPEPVAPADLSTLQSNLSTIKADLQKLLDARALHKEIAAALDSIAEAQAERDTFAGIEWALQKVREAELASAGGPLFATMEEFLVAAGRTEKTFIRANGIGWRRADGTEVQVQTMSGAEWCLFTAALTAAVAIARPAVVKILLVEAGEATGYLPQLFAGIEKVSAGLTAALVFSSAMETKAPAGWNTIRCVEQLAGA